MEKEELANKYALLAKVSLAPDELEKAREEIARAVLGKEAGKVREIENREAALEQELADLKE